MGPEVHVTFTRQWALDEGFSEREAQLIARADGAFDGRYPALMRLGNIPRHFAPLAWVWSSTYLARAVRWGDLMMLGYALHCAQDGVAHGRLGTRHLAHTAGLRPNPDLWQEAPSGVRRRTEAVTRERLRRYRARWR